MSKKNTLNFNENSPSQQGTRNNNIRVCVRMRPLLEHEDMEFWQTDKEKNLVYTDNYYSDQSEIINESYAITNMANKSLSYTQKDIKKVLIDSIYAPQRFGFDKVYSIDSESQIIYKEMCKDVVSSTLQGFNGSIFMYGQTTSGKTFTMLGSPNSPGILPCTLRDVFIMIKKIKEENKNITFNVYVSYVEIYNENIHDLLTDANFLKLVDDKKYGIIVAGAKRVKIENFEHGIGIKDYGEENRKYRETLFNEYSSRSHSIFQIFVESFESKETGEYGKSLYSCLNLVDLAGSERINEYESKNLTTGETGYINKSLFVLAHVINKLAENNNKKSHIPYRDSKLTRLLSQALGGNSLTTIICTISPASINYYQTLSTLRFATRAKTVKLKASANEITDDKEKIEFYKNEIKRLKEELKNKNRINNSESQSLNDSNKNSENNYKNITDSSININNIKTIDNNGLAKKELEKIMDAYESLNNELRSYKELYINEKIKSDKFKEQIESMKKNNIDDLHISGKRTEIVGDPGNDNVFIDEIVSQMTDTNQTPKNPNSVNTNSKWKDETSRLSQNYKNDLSSLKMAYKQKIMLLHNSMFDSSKNLTQSKNQNTFDYPYATINGANENSKNNLFNNFKNNFQQNKVDINLKTLDDRSTLNEIKNNFIPYDKNNNYKAIDNITQCSSVSNHQNKFLSNCIDKNNIKNETSLQNDEENTLKNSQMNDDLKKSDEILSKIDSSNIFSTIQLTYQIENTTNNFEKNVNDLKILYEAKIDSLEKTMDYYKSYMENYFKEKVRKVNDPEDLENIGMIDGELPVMKITSEHNKYLSKLRLLYEEKIKELETDFFTTLRLITAKRMNEYD